VGKLCFFAWVVFRIHLKSLELGGVDRIDNRAGADPFDSGGVAGTHWIRWNIVISGQ